MKNISTIRIILIKPIDRAVPGDCKRTGSLSNAAIDLESLLGDLIDLTFSSKNICVKHKSPKSKYLTF